MPKTPTLPYKTEIKKKCFLEKTDSFEHLFSFEHPSTFDYVKVLKHDGDLGNAFLKTIKKTIEKKGMTLQTIFHVNVDQPDDEISYKIPIKEQNFIKDAKNEFQKMDQKEVFIHIAKENQFTKIDVCYSPEFPNIVFASTKDTKKIMF